jgi:hypothetical protein
VCGHETILADTAGSGAGPGFLGSLETNFTTEAGYQWGGTSPTAQDEEHEPEDERLGRIIFERRHPRRTSSLIVFAAVLTLCPLPLILFGVAKAALVVALCLLAVAVACGLWARHTRIAFFRCHEWGVRKHGLFSDERLRYRDVASFTYATGPDWATGSRTTFRLVFKALPQQKPRRVRYSVTLRNADAELENLRDQISSMLARRMIEQFQQGQPVRWTDNLCFLPEGLQYRPGGGRRKAPQVLPYDQIAGYKIDQDTVYKHVGYALSSTWYNRFSLWSKEGEEPVIVESPDVANFFPGLIMLSLLMANRDHPSVRGEKGVIESRAGHLLSSLASQGEVGWWKEYQCVGCGGTFACLLGVAIKFKAVKNEPAWAPCPTCGLVQPALIGAQRARRHWWVFWGTLVYLVLLVLLHLPPRGLVAEAVIWLATLGSAWSVVAHLLVDRTKPNRDLDANLQLARRMLESGCLQQGHPDKTELPAPEVRAPPWSTLHRLAFLLMLVALGVLTLPELVRGVRGWPINRDWRPRVVGPGDETCAYLPDSITSVNQLWHGTAVVEASVAGNPNQGAFKVPAFTKTDSWQRGIPLFKDHGGRFGSRMSGNTTAPLWVSLRLPDRPDLVGKTLDLKIDLEVIFPVEVAPLLYRDHKRSIHQTLELRLASANAAKEYNKLWWLGVLGGSTMLLAMNFVLIGMAKALRRQGSATSVYADRGEPARPSPE